MRKNLLSIFLTLTISALCLDSFGQGITTASIRGEVRDENDEILPGANVVVTHKPSGTSYGTVTDLNGRYRLANVRIGGPYEIVVSFVGYEDQVLSNIYLTLGQSYSADVVMKEGGLQLDEIQILARKNSVLNGERTGAATDIGNEQIVNLPSLSRGLEDFNRLTPQANLNGNGISFAGVNNRYNQFAVDGIVNNDVFGLAASGTNGGQTGVEPISLDAIQEVQVTLAPYDVRLGGFAGGGINAVTRSGTNDFEGSVYYFLQNQDFVGKSPDDFRQDFPEFREYQTGFRLGGPLVKDKLFFFINGEVTNSSSPVPFNPLDPNSGSNITPEEVAQVEEVIGRLGYDPGTAGIQNDELRSEKFLTRLDWNINQDHKLTFRHNYVLAEELDNINRSPSFATFSNDAIFFPSETHTVALELNSNIGTQFSNQLTFGYTQVRDNRTFVGAPFPEVEVRLGGGRSLRFGAEEPSHQNQLDQDIFTITDNFTWYNGRHTITVGTHNEFYSFFNLFLRRDFGEYRYDLDDFLTVGTDSARAPNRFRHNYAFSGNPRDAGADFNAAQIGFYVQDEYSLQDNLNVTLGLRIDIPILSDDPNENTAFNNSSVAQDFDVRTDRLAEGIVMWSPRLGFNWDVNRDRTLQVRGGVGLFSSRVPFVWISNQYSNTGTTVGSVNIFSQDDFPAGFDLVTDPFNQPQADFFGFSEGAAEINVIDRDFKYPQVFRLNLAVDKQLPGGIVGTFEGIYTKTVNNITFQNINRPISSEGNISGPDRRPLYDDNLVDTDFANVILLGNTNEGFTYNLTATLLKPFSNGFTAMLSYNWGDAFDVNPGTSSTATSNWEFVENVNGANNVERNRADFSSGHRVVASASYSLPFKGGHFLTTSFFYNLQSGRPFSYIIDGDVNGDGGDGNDLIYIPTRLEINRMNFTSDAERQEFADFIDSREYLRDNRGDFAERNGDRLPFESQLDGRVMLDIKLPTNTEYEHRIQISFDVFNIGNLINPRWGRTFAATGFDNVTLLELESAAGSPDPVYSFNEGSLVNNRPYFVQDLTSRWRGQLGIRYLFGR